MPLLDHFHPPLLGQRHWEGFHGWWAAAIAGRLNEDLLPPEYFAEFRLTLGTRVVEVFNSAAGRTLVAAIELVGPVNKDRGESRRAFAERSAAYLQQGVGLMIVDIVTSHDAKLHEQTITLLGQVCSSFPAEMSLYATAYRPARRGDNDEIHVWREPLALGQPLPTLPLAVRGLGCLPIDLEGTYMEARKRGRIG